MPTARKSDRTTDVRVPGQVWDIPTWCASLGIGRSTFYVLDVKPRTVKLGRLLRIIEQPNDYAERLAKLQAEEKQAAA